MSGLMGISEGGMYGVKMGLKKGLVGGVIGGGGGGVLMWMFKVK
ncbi:hypothetical protein [Bacillus pumilus]|nr:hypothetical protein [Bacillus pumilus]